MNTAIGFTLISTEDEKRLAVAKNTLLRAVSTFTDLDLLELNYGNTIIQLWGRSCLDQSVRKLHDGSHLSLIGSPVGPNSWIDLQEGLYSNPQAHKIDLPWDGRFILLWVSADGKCWTFWNDWVGSIPVFYSPLNDGWVISTLEPVVVATVDFSVEDFFMPGLVSLLINGHFLGDWTLFRDMKMLPPDCEANWDENGFHYKKLETVIPSDDRWEVGWDELVDEMFVLSKQAITDALKTQPSWILPLSGGLDSRLIAAVGSELEVDLHSFSWGSSKSKDVVFARQIADTLNLPWKHVDLGDNYLLHFTKTWANLFGSAMHFHGMYQIPFLESLKTQPPGPIAIGFLGETIAGSHDKYLVGLHSNSKPMQILPDGYTLWKVEDIESLLKTAVKDELELISEKIQNEINSMPGPWYHRLRFLDLWNRQRRFIYFQSVLSDYWRGVTTPYLNRDYARFMMSLPRIALEGRRLQIDLFRRYYPKLAAIPGTYGKEPLILTGRYLLQKRINSLLPEYLKFDLGKDTPGNMDSRNVMKAGWDAFWPMEEVWEKLECLFDLNKITEIYDKAITGDQKSIRQINSIQTIAYRFN